MAENSVRTTRSVRVKQNENGRPDLSRTTSTISVLDISRRSRESIVSASRRASQMYTKKKDRAFQRVYEESTRGKKHPYEKLVRMDEKRRVVQKKNEIVNPFYSLFFFEGAGIGNTMRDSVWLTTMGVYIVVRAIAILGHVDYELDPSKVAVVGGLLTFFQVFFLSTQYERYNGRFKISMIAFARCMDSAALARTHMEPGSARQFVRYMNAAHIASYIGFTGESYSYSNLFQPLNEKWKLLTESECQRMCEIDMDSGGNCYRELYLWALSCVRECQQEGHLDPELAQEFRSNVLNLRRTVAELYDYAGQPIPYFFLYFVCYLQIIYLPLLAVSMAFSVENEPVNIATEIILVLTVSLASFFMVGMRVIGQMMSDPYGDDLVDLTVLSYVEDCCECTFTMLESSNKPKYDRSVEDMLWQGRHSTSLNRGVTASIDEEGSFATEEDGSSGLRMVDIENDDDETFVA